MELQTVQGVAGLGVGHYFHVGSNHHWILMLLRSLMGDKEAWVPLRVVHFQVPMDNCWNVMKRVYFDDPEQYSYDLQDHRPCNLWNLWMRRKLLEVDYIVLLYLRNLYHNFGHPDPCFQIQKMMVQDLISCARHNKDLCDPQYLLAFFLIGEPLLILKLAAVLIVQVHLSRVVNVHVLHVVDRVPI